jgi:hypothetical protein
MGHVSRDTGDPGMHVNTLGTLPRYRRRLCPLESDTYSANSGEQGEVGEDHTPN